MSEKEVVDYLRGRGEHQTLDALFAAKRRDAWSDLRDAARARPEMFDEAVLAWIDAHAGEAPWAPFAIRLDLAARAPARAEGLIARYRELLAANPAAGLAAAGYNLHEYHRLLDARWIAEARKHFDADPEGAWGIATSAAMYAPALLCDADLDWFEARADKDPEACARTFFQLAASDGSRRARVLPRALKRFDVHPAHALKQAAAVVRAKELQVPELLAAALRALPSNPEAGWEFFTNVSYESPAPIDDAVLDALEAQAATGAKSYFNLLHRIAGADPARAAGALERFARLLPRQPAAGVGQAKYVALNDPQLLTPALLDAVAAHFAADAYSAFDVMAGALRGRPELLLARHVEAAAAHIPLATNWAFGFFRQLLERRPETAPICTLALFECVAHEPPNRAHMRVEELQAIVTIAQGSHVKTQLETTLREPPTVGSRRARALMAILFRQKLRAKQHVLFEALRMAATGVTWTNRNRTPLWDFFLLLIDESPDKAITTAAAERFLEGAFQLTYLMDRGTDHDVFRDKFAVDEPAPAAWPEAASFLAEDAGLDRLHRVVRELARRCGATVRLEPLEDYAARAPRAERELGEIAHQLETAEGERRARLEKRRAHLEGRLALWRDKAPDAAGRAELARERKGLRKSAGDALRAELARIAVEAVEGARLGLYEAKIEAALGRKMDLSAVDSSILPAFLFLSAVEGMKNNRKWLARLIEDRLLGRPHDWLRGEPAAQAWQERVRAGQPGIKLEHWRAPFAKEYDYAPADASRERKRRMKEDLAQTRKLLESQGAKGLKDESYEELSAAFDELRAPRAPEAKKEEDAPKPPDPEILEEIRMNLERVKIVSETPESDYHGRIKLEVESDPFQVLFMGEYGFASCLSLRGSNVWSAVSNAIDVDKSVVWAREAGTNVVGRRLIALTPDGILSYRTYANRHGLSLDKMFDDFLDEYAKHCGTRVTHGKSPGPLLSDRWYDDGAI